MLIVQRLPIQSNYAGVRPIIHPEVAAVRLGWLRIGAYLWTPFCERTYAHSQECCFGIRLGSSLGSRVWVLKGVPTLLA